MLEEMNFSRDDFIRSNWREKIASAERKTAESYGRVFYQAALENKESGNTALHHVFLLLHMASHLLLRPENRDHPFAPIWQGTDGSRSGDINDLTDSHLSLLKEIFQDIDDPELRSRIGDVIWTFQPRGNFLFAESAIDAYIDAGENFLLTDEFMLGVERLNRAIHLAASLGRNSRKFSLVVAKIEELITRNAPAHSPFVGNLLELLYEFREGDFNNHALIAESLANHDEQERVWYLARTHWKSAANWYRLSENNEAEQVSLLKQAECYVYEAEEVLKHSEGTPRSVAAHHLQSAIEAFRQIPGTDARQKELHIQMLELQASSRDELGEISETLDLTPFVEKAFLAVKDKPFLEALFSFCLLGFSPDVKGLRDTVERMSRDHPLLSWISMNVIDENGRVVGSRGSLFSGTPEEIEEAKIAEMHKWARYEQDALAIVVNAARLELRLEHRFELNDLLNIAAHNPFIPPNRELIYARGFQFGFQGDFLEAMHLLIPQVENSLRYLLKSQGVITTSLSSEGIQEEQDINTLLAKSELVEILGEDLVFDLAGTLISRFGSNFRNLMAHGLLNQRVFYSNSAIYIWWLLLRICCLPFIIAQHQEENKDATTKN